MDAKSGASGSSLAAMGLTAFADIERGRGTESGYEFRAAQAERAAQIGRTQADLTDAVMRERLNTTIANIDVIRGAARTDPTSPTGVAMEDYARKIGDRQRTAAVGSILQQASEDEASAVYFRQAGKFALKQSYLNAGIDVLGGVSKAFMAFA